MRVVMIHAVAESLLPTKRAFDEVFPQAQLVNLLDEGLWLDFGAHLTPALRRRLTELVCYSAAHEAHAIGLACSVYSPMVALVQTVVEVPVVSSYGPVMAEAVRTGRRIGLIAAVPATLREAEGCLREAARAQGVAVEVYPRLAEELMGVQRREGDTGFSRRLAAEVAQLPPQVDAVVLAQFSMAAAVAHLQTVVAVPVLSAPHSSARALKALLAAS
jgi:Asp/Glu/hydantoin racemase